MTNFLDGINSVGFICLNLSNSFVIMVYKKLLFKVEITGINKRIRNCMRNRLRKLSQVMAKANYQE